jgi:hypothetical protein
MIIKEPYIPQDAMGDDNKLVTLFLMALLFRLDRGESAYKVWIVRVGWGVGPVDVPC